MSRPQGWEEDTKARTLTPTDKIAVEQGCWFDREAAARIVAFAETYLCQTSGPDAGKPLKLMQWQKKVCEELIGWKNAEGLRRFRSGSVWVPRRNGKSLLVCVLTLYLLTADGQTGAECYSISNSLDHGMRTIVKELRALVEGSPKLRDHLIYTKGRLAFPRTNSFYQCLGTSSRSAAGTNASLMILDELYASANPELFHTVRYGRQRVGEPLVPFVISTAGQFNLGTIGYAEYNRCKQVARGLEPDTTYYALIYEVDPEAGEDYQDEEMWKKANPALAEGALPMDVFRTDYDQAKVSISDLANFLMFKLGIWQEKSKVWIENRFWKRLRVLPQDTPFPPGCVVTSGYDLAATRDIVGCCHLAWDKKADHYYLKAKGYICKSQAYSRTRKDKIVYDTWIQQGWLKVAGEDCIDYREVEVDIRKDALELKPVRMLFDPWSARELVQRLEDDGLPVFCLTQSYNNVSPAMKFAERIILEQKLTSMGDNPVLQWCLANMVVDTDPEGKIRYDKKKSAEKIDVAVAFVMACSAQETWELEQGGWGGYLS